MVKKEELIKNSKDIDLLEYARKRKEQVKSEFFQTFTEECFLLIEEAEKEVIVALDLYKSDKMNLNDLIITITLPLKKFFLLYNNESDYNKLSMIYCCYDYMLNINKVYYTIKENGDNAVYFWCEFHKSILFTITNKKFRKNLFLLSINIFNMAVFEDKLVDFTFVVDPKFEAKYNFFEQVSSESELMSMVGLQLEYKTIRQPLYCYEMDSLNNVDIYAYFFLVDQFFELYKSSKDSSSQAFVEYNYITNRINSETHELFDLFDEDLFLNGISYFRSTLIDDYLLDIFWGDIFYFKYLPSAKDGFNNNVGTEYIQMLKKMIKMYNILYEENKNLKNSNMKVRNANNKIKSIIRSFAHRAVHVEADNIFSVATTLQKNNGNPEDIKKLLLCYEENLDLKRNINILKLEASNDYASFKSSVEYSIASENNGSVLNIFDIIDASLKRTFSKILYTDSERTFHIRKSMEQSGVEMDKLVEKYRENILIKDGNCLELLCNNFNFSVESMSEEWNEVHLFKDSDGTTILVSLFMELFLNMFTYADFSKKIRLLLSNDKLDKYTYLSIELLNAIKDEKKVFSTQAGIISTNETLKLLNSDKDGKNEVEEYIQKETTEEGLFKTKILLREYLFL